jgi:subtilisin family serine protease
MEVAAMASRILRPTCIASTAAALLLTQAAAQPPASYFYSNGERISISIVPNTVALEAEGDILRKSDEPAVVEMAPMPAAEQARFASLAASGIVAVRTRAGRTGAMRGILRSSGLDDAGLVVAIGGDGPVAVLTPEFIVRFKADVTRQRIDEINAASSVVIDREDPFRANQFVLRMANDDPAAALTTSARYYELPEVDSLSHPNFIVAHQTRSAGAAPDDPLRSEQWHLDIIKAPEAWTMSRGNGVVLSVIDPDGVEIKHEDLIGSRFQNMSEVPDNGRDDDNNGLVDDVSGWNFRSRSNDPKTERPHGTAAAGVAVAACDNGLGGCGVAPETKLLAIAKGRTVQDDADAFRYAARMGAGVISNSWGYALSFPTTQVVEEAIADVVRNGRGGRGTVVLFAMTNEHRDNFGGGADRYRDISAMADVIAVGRSTDLDRWGLSGFGLGMAVLGPTNAAKGSATAGCLPKDLAGKLDIVTADLTGRSGYNRNGAGTCGCNPSLREHANSNYTSCFGGTSSATPLVAGVVALMLAANPQLTVAEVRSILAETSDRIEAPAAGYRADASGQLYSATHGWGRVNAAAAVRAAVARTTTPAPTPAPPPSPGGGPVDSRAAAPQAVSTVAGKAAEEARVPQADESAQVYVWKDTRALVLSDKATREQLLKALGGSLRVVNGSVLARDLAANNVVLVEGSPQAFSAANERLAVASNAGIVEQIGRVAFSDPQEGSSAAVLLNSFSIQPAEGVTEDQLRKEAEVRGFAVERRFGNRYVLTPKDSLIDPVLAAASAEEFAKLAVVSSGSLRAEWITPTQKR